MSNETDRIIADAQQSSGMSEEDAAELANAEVRAHRMIVNKVERTFRARFEGGDGGETEIQACTLADALDLAESWTLEGDWGEPEETIWASVDVRCEATGEEDSRRVAIDPEPPKCERGEEHEWKGPIEIVGGIEENPGVWGHGGGVLIHRVCMKCGCGRTVDTWAQDRNTGEQGLESVSYEPGKYSHVIGEQRD